MPSSLITRGIKTNISKGLGNSGTSSPMSVPDEDTGFGRVTRVVLDQSSCTEDEWNLYQKSQALYGVFYKKLQIGVDGQVLEIGSEKFAYCSNPTLRRIPIKNEIVRLTTGLGADLAAQNNNVFQQKIYWTNIVPTWNHPHLNLLPNLQKSTVSEDEYVKDRGNDINPLQLCPGDVTLEGRYGESLRFGGTWYKDSPIATEGTNGKPYIILRAGQGADNNGQGDKALYEDVNLDSGSLYITTGHIVPLDQAANKRSAWKGKKLEEAKDYSNPQVVLTSDRVWLNGRDDIEMSAKNFIGMTADEVNVDGQGQVSLDADKIYLGKGSQDEGEPVLKGTTTVKMISNLTDQYITLLETMIKAGSTGNGDPRAFIGALQSIAKLLLPVLKTYKGQLPNLYSKKVFTE